MRDTLLDKNKKRQNHNFTITFKFTMRKMPHFKLITLRKYQSVIVQSASTVRVNFAQSKTLGSVIEKVKLRSPAGVFSLSLILLCLFAWH